ncbi:MAG: helix-turn-helix protein [Spartobacteria bacterium]|nr:helix-turn-helix protein [Spartobacteria bacterium]
MTIEGLGKKFQEARLARNLTLDEAARMTKIRPSRLAEIEADDFSQFPSLAYAKGFLLIYGKFLDVDVGPYMEAFETSEHVTVDGYSYLQEEPAPAPVRTPVVRRRPSRNRPSAPAVSSGDRPSLMPVVIGIAVILIGFWIGKLVVNLRRLSAPAPAQQTAAQPSVPAQTPVIKASIAPAPIQAPAATQAIVSATSAPVATVARPSIAPAATSQPTAAPVVAVASPSSPPAAASPEPEVRRAEPVRAEDLAKAKATEPSGSNRIAIRPLKKTYIKVIVDDEAKTPAFERWISPSDGTMEFRGEHVAVRVLDRDAIQIKKNGKALTDEDSDVTIE